MTELEKNKNKHTQGFTLAELLIVVAIIAVLVAVSVPMFMSKKKKTEDTVCQYNRKTLVRQIMLDRMGDDGLSDADAEAVLEKSDAYCPAGGEYTVQLDELYIKVICDIHGASMGGTEDIKVSDTFVSDYRDFTVEYLKNHTSKENNNDLIRKAFLEKYNGKWPTLTVGSDSYSIQPYYQGKDQSKPVEECVWLFARKDETAASGWHVPYVYNIVDGKWYGATKTNGSPGGSANIVYDDIKSLDEAIKNKKHANGKLQWAEVTGYKESD
ncbi:prepilin-type N-terminal cleavage/methylation domain-containing protein [Clostridium sp. MCC353]|uniref:prepilin-type N-terminal cleavage/methylation domain-containing protein n=1 Tax=Clostridium sp. MCC353 TaxID=2592646 RepID=UPI001C030E87|nr:prepilin-type N-terminal cleavage/methylation domain-containing protein [Clostridium sp. MCC353]MBT9779185.1 prepilin-type N-terminal cleavage/methylation domain-containing protein [Clostridium sp. MCC353]